MNGRDLLIYLAIKYQGDYNNILKAVNLKVFPDEQEVKKELEKLDCEAITMLDPNYPEYIKSVPYAPTVLFYKGDISLISTENFKKNLAVIGTRNPSEYGINLTKEIVDKVCYHLNIVSGLAIGIDGIAQSEAVLCGGKTIAVLGSGFNHIYPTRHIKLANDIIDSGGLLISEYPPDVEPIPDNFPYRNRIIAGLSSGILVTEAYDKSGTSRTVNYGLESGRTIMCPPYPLTIKNSFCNQLLYEGATFVRDGEDVIDTMLFFHKNNIGLLK